MSPSRRLFRNLGYTAAIIVWLAVMLLPCFAFALIARGELEWRRGEDSDRVWLIQERDEKGLGYESQRLFQTDATTGAACIKTSVRFFLWEGSQNAQNADYCECRAPDGTTQPTNCP